MLATYFAPAAGSGFTGTGLAFNASRFFLALLLSMMRCQMDEVRKGRAVGCREQTMDPEPDDVKRLQWRSQRLGHQLSSLMAVLAHLNAAGTAGEPWQASCAL